MVVPDIDMDIGSMWDKLEHSSRYWNETRDYIQYCLDLTIDHFKSVNAPFEAFETIGTAIRKAYKHGLLVSHF